MTSPSPPDDDDRLSTSTPFPNPITALISRFRALVYDTFILRLTSTWYAAVLERLPQNATVLDVGIGTAGALLRCESLLRSRNIRVVGIDLDADYVSQARIAISRSGLNSHVSVSTMSVYDVLRKRDELELSLSLLPEGGDRAKERPRFDAVYFSGSFSLLPDRTEALRVVSRLLHPTAQSEASPSPRGDGRIYITQTYQRRAPPFLSYFKPLMRYVTTIDFGKLVSEQEARDFFYCTVKEECGLDVVEHDVVKGSVDNFLQAGYLTVLQPIKEADSKQSNDVPNI